MSAIRNPRRSRGIKSDPPSEAHEAFKEEHVCLSKTLHAELFKMEMYAAHVAAMARHAHVAGRVSFRGRLPFA